MYEQLKQISQRLIALREVEEITTTEMAEKLNIDPKIYKEYESGNVDIPVSILYEVANICNVELTALLSGEEPKLKIYQLVRKGKGLAVDRRKEYKYQNLAYNLSNKGAEPFLVVVPANGNEEIFTNVHAGQEFDYMLEGTLKLMLNGQELILNEGDSIYYDSSYPHGMAAVGGKDAKFIAVILQ